jgi:hypothetical protein
MCPFEGAFSIWKESRSLALRASSLKAVQLCHDRHVLEQERFPKNEEGLTPCLTILVELARSAVHEWPIRRPLDGSLNPLQTKLSFFID